GLRAQQRPTSTPGKDSNSLAQYAHGGGKPGHQCSGGDDMADSLPLEELERLGLNWEQSQPGGNHEGKGRGREEAPGQVVRQGGGDSDGGKGRGGEGGRDSRGGRSWERGWGPSPEEGMTASGGRGSGHSNGHSNSHSNSHSGGSGHGGGPGHSGYNPLRYEAGGGRWSGATDSVNGCSSSTGSSAHPRGVHISSSTSAAASGGRGSGAVRITATGAPLAGAGAGAGAAALLGGAAPEAEGYALQGNSICTGRPASVSGSGATADAGGEVGRRWGGGWGESPATAAAGVSEGSRRGSDGDGGIGVRAGAGPGAGPGAGGSVGLGHSRGSPGGGSSGPGSGYGGSGRLS
ncbi:unnamed protein product, partial [Discosporangium mesarthrocarpum]